MPDLDDDLDRLRRADPVDTVSLPSANEPEARALLEEITMSDTMTRRPTRRYAVVAAAAAVVLAIMAATAVALFGGRDAAPGNNDIANGPITPGGPATGSCVEVYDLTTLANRETAFDGTVASVDTDRVTFDVKEWFRGGDTSTVTLSGASSLGGLTSAGPAANLEPGTRLLVAGDGGFAWSCGFTQPYDESVAEDWASTLRQ